MDLADKLQIRPGWTGVCIGLPPHLTTAFGFLTAPRGHADCAVGFCNDPADVARILPELLARPGPDGVWWMAYRKGKTGAAAGLTRDIGLGALRDPGFDTVRAIAIHDRWSGLRFRRMT